MCIFELKIVLLSGPTTKWINYTTIIAREAQSISDSLEMVVLSHLLVGVVYV